MGERVENYEKFKQDLQRLKYLGKFASQEKQENLQIINESKSINSSGNNQSLESSKASPLDHDDSDTSSSSEAKIMNVKTHIPHFNLKYKLITVNENAKN